MAIIPWSLYFASVAFHPLHQQILPMHDRGQSISMMAMTVASGQVMIAAQRQMPTGIVKVQMRIIRELKFFPSN